MSKQEKRVPLHRPEEFKRWLLSVAQRVVTKKIKKDYHLEEPNPRRQSQTSYLDWMGSHQRKKPDDPAEIAEQRELLENLERCLGQLSETQQKVIRGYMFEGLTFEVIGSEIENGISAQAAQSRFEVAINKLRRIVKKLAPDLEDQLNGQ